MTGLLVSGIMIALIAIEIAVFGIIGAAIGVFLTIIGVFITAILGIALMRTQMLALLASGAITRPPHEIMPKVLCITIGGICLLIPGYASDAFGILCFIPSIEHILGRLLFQYLPAARAQNFAFSYANMHQQNHNENPADPAAPNAASDMIIDGEAEHIDENEKYDKNNPEQF